jgi:hypothetical protein
VKDSLTALGPAGAATAYVPVMDALTASFGARLETVVLFGSRARGEARPESDHDLFVVVEDLPRDPVARARTLRTPLFPVLDRLPGHVGLVGRTPEEVRADLTPLLLDVCTDGICLYGAAYFEPLRQQALAALRRAGLVRRRVAGALMWVFPDLQPRTWELRWGRESDHG